jgi:DNA-binding CsgD family transcriptional regulator
VAGVSPWGRASVAVARICQVGGDPYDLLERVADVVQQVVPHDGAAWSTVDPRTLLFTGAVVRALPEATCHPYYEHLFADDAVLPYASLAAGRQQAGSLHKVTQGRPQRTALWRNVLEPFGYVDELRSTCTSRGHCWGTVSLWRARGAAPFDTPEIAFLGRIGSMVGGALRSAATLGPVVETSDSEGCAVVLLDRDGKFLEATGAGQRWLEDFVAGHDPSNRFSVLDYVRALGAHVPKGQSATTRLSGPDRRWHTLQASALTNGGTAVVIQPSQPDELVDTLLLAYGLSPREVEILCLICQGLTSQEISARLIISAHTARDHIKHILAKVGVTSRGELVAKLFTEHYWGSLQRTGRA